MEAIVLVTTLLEKVAVLVATALVLLLLRPAEVWLGDTGARVSRRRRLFLILVFSILSNWGVFLGLRVGGVAFNTRSVGIIVAGALGGPGVGAIVGASSGILYSLVATDELALYVLAASIADGLLSGLWVRRFGARSLSLIAGATIAQAAHHATLGLLLFAISPERAFVALSNLQLHVAKIAANTIGVTLFMGLLRLFRELDHARAEATSERAAARDARLSALQYQLRPHFLFNLLNTLAYLIRTNPIKARELTLELADFLRYTLAREDQETPLREELRQISRYVELERARFGDGLSFTIDPAPDELTAQRPVPPLLLQPLVENAIRHGANPAGGAHVRLGVTCAPDDTLTITVADAGPGPATPLSFSPDTPPPAIDPAAIGGVGLPNVWERLDRFFHGRATLTLEAGPEGGSIATITISPVPPPRPEHAARALLRRIVE
jgi:two-component system, LytTR family, sensor kinase